ncbi:MAG: hypothetical protein K2N33_02010, partial [Clostridia bacterium]|nr:hypothetical protein [Clostridia bacterium]
MKKFNALNKKTTITGILAFLCALLVAVSFGLLGSNKNIANAQNTATLANDIKIGEITLSDYETRADGKVFNGAALDKLYNLLVGGGATNQTYANVDALVPAGSTVSYGKGSNTTLLPAFKSAKQLYQDNDNKNIVLNFGGDEWTVTFLTRTGEGNSSDHIIATLWLTDVYKENSAVVYTKFGWTTSTNGGDCNSLYPSTMYSTSQARVETLNAGGMLATNATTATSVAQDPSSHWAKFTMPSVNGSLTNYIVQPDNVKYQHYIAYGAQTNSNTKMQNETLSYWSGTDVDFSLGCNYTTSGLNFNSGSSAAHYNDWGADYLWLPAASEIGFIGSWKVPGFWETVSDNASQYTGQTLHNTATAWLRSGSGNTTHNGNPLWADGHGEGVLSSTLLGVRPALHLDLTAAAQAAALETPKGVTQYDDNGTLKDIVYDYSKTWTLTDFGTGAGWYDFANCITNTQYKYKNSGDVTAFDTANPGVTPTSGLH